jgi:hypothetical protein
MSKLHIFKKGIKRNVKSHTIDFKLFVQQKHAPFHESICSLYELDEKPNYAKFSKSLNFERKGCKEKDLKKKPFDKRIVFNGFKVSSLRCRSHV